MNERPTKEKTMADLEQFQDVLESDWDVDTNLDIQTGDRIIFEASGSIWAGVWFTGRNGPRGWNNIANDLKFPYPPGHPYSVLGNLDGRYFEIGDGFERVYTGKNSRLWLRINDDEPGNGNGGFQCRVLVYRSVGSSQPTDELFPGVPGYPR
jgi:hypothetical protein